MTLMQILFQQQEKKERMKPGAVKGEFGAPVHSR